MSGLGDIIQRKKERGEKLRSALASIVKQLQELGALKIILFGSLDEEEVDIDSDLDLLVLMPVTRTGREWMKLVYEQVERKVASDIIVYNEKEFDEQWPVSSFLQNIVNSGRVVYEKTV